VRAVVLKGSGFEDVASELVWLTAILALLVVLSSLRFRKKLL
jgi:hypothetical protein